MKLVNFIRDGRSVPGIVTERGTADLSQIPGAPRTLREILAMGREDAAAALKDAEARAERFLSDGEIVCAPAADDPEKILCVGKNYRDHVSEVPELFTVET